MKTLFTTVFCLFTSFVLAQVGVNTDNPRPGVALDVIGSFKSNTVILPTMPPVTVGNRLTYLYLVQDPSDFGVKELDLTVSGSSGGISTLITFELENVFLDWVLDFDTKVNADDYALVVLSATFDRELIGQNPALPVARTKIIGGTYHIEADYSAIASDSNGTWHINCVAYPKTYAKIFPTQTVVINTDETGNNQTGSATTPVVDF